MWIMYAGNISFDVLKPFKYVENSLNIYVSLFHNRLKGKILGKVENLESDNSKDFSD